MSDGEETEVAKKPIIGPQIPPELSNVISSEREVQCEAQPETYGPALPPSFVKPSFVSGPECGVDNESEEDDDIIGPLPVQHGGSAAQIELERRAEYLKHEFANKEKETSVEQKRREKWMLELPEEKSVKLGLGARKFKVHVSGDKKNRSLWTATPDSDPKELEKPEDSDRFSEVATETRNKKMEEIAKKHKRKEQKSLLELHEDKLRKDKKKKKEECERRPFSRDIDLQVNRFDEAQKKSIIKKAKLLDSRFSQGESKFL